MNVIRDAPHLGRWLIPVLAGLGVLGARLVPAIRHDAGAGRGDIDPSSRRPGAAASADPVSAGAARAQQ